MKLMTAAAGALLLASAFASPSSAAPVAPTSNLILGTDLQTAPTEARWHGRRWNRGHHYGWRRGHHRGWRYHHRRWR